MAGHIAIVQISHPGPADGDGEAFWRTGAGGQLEAMYGELLGLRPIWVGYHKLVHEDGAIPEIGFEYSPLDPPPRWPDPEHPQQVHLDITVADLDQAEALATGHGATVLRREDGHRVLADPVGHPFCLYPGAGGPGRIERVVFDCFSPRGLAAFYEAFLQMRRTLDTPARVEIAGDEGVVLAFQHSVGQAPRWPDPAFPAQLHLDLAFEGASARETAERLGAIYCPTPGRPDHVVYADPAGHPFCLGVDGWGTYGLAQVEVFESWVRAAGSGE